MKLRDYQIEISDKAKQLLIDHKIAFLAMKPRTGKTLTALETVLKYGAINVLFVTKKKAIKSIVEDAKHYPALNLTVINYESVSKCDNNFNLIVIDESHSISAYPKKTKRVDDLLVFTKDKPIIYLSGTPTPESYSQIYHQMYVSSFSPFKKWSNFYRWSKEFVNVKQRMINGNMHNDYSDAKIDLISEYVNHLFLTQTQQEAGFDVSIEECFIYVEMNDKQRWAINKLINDKVIETKDGFVILADTAVKCQSKIHQLCSGSIKTETGEILTISTDKAQSIKEKFKGKKIAIFYKFIGELNILKQVFDNWTDSPEEFQSNQDNTYLGQFVSSREGVRLDTADCIVFYNIDFSYLSYDQAKERIISKERTKKAVLYWVFTKGGIEEKIYKAVCKKQDYTNYYFKKDYGIKSTKQAD